ncbi:MAG: 1-acyl-sn-glycerol-3-phosphate acyltransferase, partial [Mesorhizobium sp.]
MIGKIRIFLALGLVVVGSLILVPLQILSMKTGLWRETFVLKIWHRLIIRALGMRIHVKGTLSSQRPLLVASNHISWTDIMVLGSMVDVKFIARADMAGWPLIGML